jgi:hypothetical protein
MRETSLLQLALDGCSGRYCVELLSLPTPTERGIEHGDPARPETLEWSAIQRALAAEVGEPEGVRTVVFDLVVARERGERGERFAIRRLDAEPGEDAMKWAAALERSLGGERCAAAIKNLAAEGAPSRWYPSLEEFEAAALASLEA